MRFLEEEIVVVEVHGVHAVMLHEIREVRLGARWRFEFLETSERRDDTAEIACVQAADRGLINAVAFPEGGRLEIRVEGDPMPGQHGERVGTLPGPFRIDACLALLLPTCLLYTSDAADEEDSVDLGGR